MTSPHPLYRKARSVTLGASLSGALGAVIAGYYGSFTVEIPPGFDLQFRASIFGVIAAMLTLAQILNARRLKTVFRLSKRREPPTGEEKIDAARELAGLSDWYLLVTLGYWLAGAVFAGASFVVFVAPASWWVAVRFSMVGLFFAPMMAVLSHLLVTRQARKLWGALAATMSLDERTRAIAPGSFQLRHRLVALISLLVVIPAVLTADVAMRVAEQKVREVLAMTDRAARAEAVSDSYVAMLGSVSILFAMVFAFAVLIALLAASNLGSPLRKIAQLARRMARGDLSAPEVVAAEHDVWVVASALDRMRANVAVMLESLGQAGQKIASSTGNLITFSETQTEGAADQATSLAETSATTEELARSATQISENAAEVARLAETTLAAASRGQRSAREFMDAMSNLARQKREVAEVVVALNDRVQRVGKIVDFINGISDRSDLLALNAELEGTKAGAVGQGFSLVAAEMRRLAEHALVATNEISTLIRDIRQSSQVAVVTTELGLRGAESSTQLAQKTAERLAAINELAAKTSEAAGGISSATLQQQTGTAQLAAAMEEILRVTNSNSEASGEIATTSVGLQKLARSLDEAVNKLGDAQVRS